MLLLYLDQFFEMIHQIVIIVNTQLLIFSYNVNICF